MKKLFLTLLIMMSVSVYSFADENMVNETANIERYDFSISADKLSNVLGLTSDQKESMESVLNEFVADMSFASHETNKVARYKVTANAIEKNLKYVNYFLTSEQKRAYVKLLNVTLVNRGFDIASLTKASK